MKDHDVVILSQGDYQLIDIVSCSLKRIPRCQYNQRIDFGIFQNPPYRDSISISYQIISREVSPSRFLGKSLARAWRWISQYLVLVEHRYNVNDGLIIPNKFTQERAQDIDQENCPGFHSICHAGDSQEEVSSPGERVGLV